MSRTFRYIQNDDVLRSFTEFKDVIRKRPVVIARHGDYILYLSCLSGDTMGLSIENIEKKKIVLSRTYDVNNTTQELVSRGVRHAVQKMSELNDEDVNRKRLQIWKWHIMEWQKNNPASEEEMLKHELDWDESKEQERDDILDMESYLHGEYLNLGATIHLINTYLKNEKHKDMFRRFAINDIMELTGEDTKDKSILETEKKKKSGEEINHTYRFTVSVEATDKEHARQALLNYLAGDDRIKVQK